MNDKYWTECSLFNSFDKYVIIMSIERHIYVKDMCNVHVCFSYKLKLHISPANQLKIGSHVNTNTDSDLHQHLRLKGISNYSLMIQYNLQF